jgi:mRNA interferase HicA
VKRRDLLRHLQRHRCELSRAGADHAVCVDRLTGKASTVPRHRGINEFLARRICRDLDVAEPR